MKIAVVGPAYPFRGGSAHYTTLLAAHLGALAPGVADRIRWVDQYVSNDEAALYFAAADLAVLSYREVTGSGVLQLPSDFSGEVFLK